MVPVPGEDACDRGGAQGPVGIEDDVVLPSRLREVLHLEVDHLRRAEIPEPGRLGDAADRGHGGPARVGDLHGEVTHASGGAVHEHRLPTYVPALPEAVERGEGCDRECGGLLVGEPGRNPVDLPGGDRHLLGVGPLRSRHRRGRAVDRGSPHEAGHPFAHRHDRAGEVRAEDHREPVRGPGVDDPASQHPVERVHARRVNLHDDLAATRHGLRNGGDAHHLRTAVASGHECLHPSPLGRPAFRGDTWTGRRGSYFDPGGGEPDQRPSPSTSAQPPITSMTR